MQGHPLVNDAYTSLRPYVPGKPVSETERELGIQGVIKLASNENPLGPSPKALAAAAEALPNIHDYPDGGCFYLRQRVAQKLGVAPEQLIFGNGTNEVIEMLVRTCVRSHENIVYATGSFIIYKLCALAAGREIIEVPLRDLRFDLDAMLAAITPSTKLLFIANPNNPTGTYVGRSELEAFLQRVPPQVVVVLDEAYFEYATAPDYPNGLTYLERPRTMVLRTFSKAYGLAGLRVGYGVSQPELIDYLNRGRQPFNVNALAQVAALAALDDTEHVARSRELNRQQMEALIPALRELGCTVWESQANFVLCDFGRDAQGVFEALLREGVIVRPQGGHGFPQAARITVGTQEQNRKLLAGLRKVLGAA